MGWVESTKYFCAFSETLTYVTNALVHTSLPLPVYRSISKIPHTGPGSPHTLDRLTHIHCYMDDMITVVQSGTERQRQVFDATARDLKWTFPYLPGEYKGSVILNKLKVGGGVWVLLGDFIDEGYLHR